MKKILFISFITISFFTSHAQTYESPLGGFIGSIGTILSPDTLVIDNIFDISSIRSATAIDDKYVLWNNCKRYQITEIINAVSNQALIVIDNSDNTNFVSGSICTIIEESEQGIGHYIGGLSQGSQQCISSYYANIIGSGSGGADTLYLSNGTMLVNGDTIPILSCSTERFVSPFDFTDRVVVSTVSIDTFETLDVFINGVFVNSSAYSINADSLIFSSYVIQNSDEIFISSCSTTISSSTPNLNSVLSSGNNGGGIQIKNIANPTDAQDVVTLDYFNNNSSAGGADTLYLSNGTMLVNGDTIPILECNSEQFTPPFDFTDRVVVSAISIDTFELLNVFINGIHYNNNTYTISGDSLIFNSYTLDASDIVYINVCASTVSTNAQGLNSVLSNSNDAGGLLIKNVGDPVDNQDVVTKSYLEANDKWLETELASGSVIIDGNSNAFILDTLGIFRVQNLDNSNVDYEVIFSPNTSVPLKLARYEAGDTILIEMQGGELLFRDTSGSYNLSQLANSKDERVNVLQYNYTFTPFAYNAVDTIPVDTLLSQRFVVTGALDSKTITGIEYTLDSQVTTRSTLVRLLKYTPSTDTYVAFGSASLTVGNSFVTNTPSQVMSQGDIIYAEVSQAGDNPSGLTVTLKIE